MSRWLQSFDFRKSRYERPNQKWVCGRAADGCPCRVGPDRHGRCRAQAECRPRKEGERFVCCRPQDAGGPCAEGPRPDGACAHPIPPCTPVRSTRAKRGLAARWAAAVAVGLLVIVLATDQGARWLSPGPLSASHASVQDCASCHESAGEGALGWVHAAFEASPPIGEGDSALCLSCHKPGAAPLRAHGLPAGELQTPAPDANASGVQPASLMLADRLFGSPMGGPDGRGGDGAVACATCHGEHAGTDADIGALGDRACQACHVRKVASFTGGHPAFEAYPYDRRTRIVFDHARHFRKHFPESDAAAVPGQCADCHETDARGAQMLSAGFESGCAACHAGDVRGESAAGSTGIPVVAVPGLDLETLRAHEAGIGGWPELSDRPLTPFLRAILAGDPELRPALATFRKIDPLDLREASDAEVEAVTRVAWAVKDLVYDLVDRGPGALRDRLEAGLGTQLSEAHVRAMAGGLPLAAVRDAANAWFPDLAGEIQRHRAGEPVPMPASAFGAPSDDAAGGGEDAANGGQADILGGEDTGGGDDILGGSDDTGGDILGGEEPEGDDILGGDGGGGGQEDILGGDDAGGEDILGGSDQAGGGDILGGEEPEGGDILGGGDGGGQDDILGGSDEGGGQDDILGGGGDAGGDILGGDEPSGGGLLGGDGGDGDGGGEATDSAPVEAALPEPNPESWSALGGWYRDYFALLYRPGDHADPFLRHWIEVAGRARGDGTDGADGPATAIVDLLTADGAPGQCADCHSLDATDGGVLAVNWTGFRPTPAVQGFTHFAHAPHFSRIGDETGCATCHEIAREADYLASFDDRDPAAFQSNFQPIGRETCADCHVDEAAGNACTQCHNYHVGRVRPRAMATGVDRVMGDDGE